MKITNQIYMVGSGAFGISTQGDCHCYLINGGDAYALVDCGLSTNPQAIMDELVRDGLSLQKLKYVLLTHAHPDHANAALWLQQNLGVKIICSAFEGEVLEKGLLHVLGLEENNPAYETFRTMPRTTADCIVADGDVLQIGDLQVKVIETPGHTHGSTSYYLSCEGKNHLFTGDAVFYRGQISLLSPPLSDYEHYRQGIMRLADMSIDGLFPSHLMWTLQQGQKHIDIAIQHFEQSLRPELKLYS